jgi:hypothetical protein
MQQTLPASYFLPSPFFFLYSLLAPSFYYSYQRFILLEEKRSGLVEQPLRRRTQHTHMQGRW